MSNIGQLINNRSFNPIVSNISYNVLCRDFVEAERPIGISNAFIISVPQDENGKDIVDGASIWMTDSDGYLLNITKPNNLKN